MCIIWREGKIYLINQAIEISADAQEVINTTDNAFIDEITQLILALEDLDHDNIQAKFKEFANIKGMKIGEVMKPIRALLTGSTASPSLFEIIAIIGKEHSIRRLQQR